MVIRVPKDFADDCELFIKDRVEYQNWNENDVAEFRAFVRAMWDAGLQKEIINYVKQQVEPIKEMLEETRAMYARIKASIAQDDLASTVQKGRRIRKTGRNEKNT